MPGQFPINSYSADEVVSPYIYVFYLSFALAFVLTPIMRAIALYYGIIDHPDKIRKMHKEPVAYLGGVAVFIAWLGGVAVSELLHLHRIDPGWPTDVVGMAHPIIRFGIIVGALLIALLGLWDDVYKLEPWMKIAGQISAAMFLLWDGVGLDLMRPVLQPVIALIGYAVGGGISQPPDWLVTVASSGFVIVLVVGCCNATNLMDGLDGLCGGVTAVISAGFLFVAVHLAMFGAPFQTNIDAQRVILALALLGAVLGFIPYNFNPASIFMGDTGSMFLGFVCSTMIILMGMGHLKWFLASMVIFALPILDTVLAFARRWTNGRPLFSADKQHFHHQLVARGFSVKQTVLISYALAVFFGLLGVSMVYMRTRYTIAIYMVVFGSIMVTAYKLGMIHERAVSGSAGNLDTVSADAFETKLDTGAVMEIPDHHDDLLDQGELEVAH
jgi:UDP-GlcNAc:undecaprenyl-phosphate GlcNAc-1-phosphate transferase